MPVGCITAAGYFSATLVERSIGTHPMQHAVQSIHVRGNPGAVGIEPGTRPDPIPGVYGIVSLGAQIGTPDEAALIDAFRQRLADGICPFKSP